MPRDLHAVVDEVVGSRSGGGLEPPQEVPPVDHFLDRVGAQQLEIDVIQLLRVLAAVPARPLASVADRPNAPQVDAGRQHALVFVLDQVGERQVRGVGVAIMSAHDHGERADLGGPEHVGIAAGLGASLDDALVDRSELVPVVALVRPAAGVEEREQPGDQERGFVVGHGVGSGEDRTGLTVEAAAVGKEDGILRGVVLTQHASLTDEAITDNGPIADIRTAAGDEMLRVDARSDMDGILSAAIDGAVFQPVDALNGRGRSDLDVLDEPRVADPRALAHQAHVGSDRRGVALDHRLELLDHRGSVAVEGQNIGRLSRKMIVDRDLTPTGFVDDRDRRSVAEGAFALDRQQVDVVDDRLVLDHIVGDMVVDRADVDVVANRAVVDGRVVDAGRSEKSAEE